jgi:hypothetical protein
MHNGSYGRICLYILSIYCFVGFTNAYAYLDLGSGSYILQVLVASFLGCTFALKSYWKKVRIFLSGRFSKKTKNESNNEQNTRVVP